MAEMPEDPVGRAVSSGAPPIAPRGGGGGRDSEQERPATSHGDGAPRAKKRRRLPRIRREVRWTVTVLVLAFVVEYLLLPEIASAKKSLDLLGKVNFAFLLLALALEVASLISYAELTRTVLSPNPPGRFQVLRINMSTLALSHIIPGGTAAGGALGYRLLTESDVQGSTAAFGLATQGVGSAVVLNAIFWLALLISIPLTGFNPLYGVAAIAGVLLLAAFAAAVLLLTRGRHQAVDRLVALARHVPFIDAEDLGSAVHRIAERLEVLLSDKRMRNRALLWAAANWLLDAASLWVFLTAYGATVFPIYLLVAYGLANILAVIPITPGGLGVVEGVLIPTLVGFGVTKGVAILGVLTYRFVNFWLPIPVGGASYLSLRIGHGGRARRHDVQARHNVAPRHDAGA